jgi:hypothetical protein
VLDPHRLGELRSLAKYEEVAARLYDARLDEARARAAAWARSSARWSGLAKRWLELIGGPRERLLAAMRDPSSEGAQARSATPFAGALISRGRWALRNRLPRGWEGRLVPVFGPGTAGVTGWRLETHDLLVSKAFAGSPKDLALIEAALAEGSGASRSASPRRRLRATHRHRPGEPPPRVERAPRRRQRVARGPDGHVIGVDPDMRLLTGKLGCVRPAERHLRVV